MPSFGSRPIAAFIALKNENLAGEGSIHANVSSRES
jgi:hypothetical protein